MLKGLPVGVEYIGEDYRTVTLTFPLYYMKREQTKALVEYVMNERFQEKVAVEEEQRLMPEKRTVLYSNYPNPFNPQTTVSYYLQSSSYVELTVYNIRGKKVNKLYAGHQQAGEHSLIWEGRDNNNKHVAGGVYLLRLKTDFGENHVRMLLLK